MDLKQVNEKFCADTVMAKLLPNAVFFSMGDSVLDEPDVLYQLGEKKIGVEVATVYHQNTERPIWDIARRKIDMKKVKMVMLGTFWEPDKYICKRIQDEVSEKSQHSYSGAGEVWLCIQLHSSTLSDSVSIAACAKSLCIPQKSKFEKICLLFLKPLHESGGWEVVVL